MKLNKIIYGAFALLLAGAGMSSCTDPIAFGNAALEKAPGGDVTKDTVFLNAEYTRQFLVGIYAEQYYGLPYVNSSVLPHSSNPYAGKVDALTDCWHMGWNGAAVFGQYYTGALTANVTRDDGLDGPLFSFDKEHVWEAVRAGLILIENIDKVPGFENEERQRLKAEAYCLIAARMFDLFQHFGGLPLLDHPLEVEETTGQFPRQSVENTVNYIVDCLDKAINTPEFPWVVSDPATMTGRWTRASARALKAKVLQLAASPLFNPKDGKPYYDNVPNEKVLPYIKYEDNSPAAYQARWDAFYQACKEFFDDLSANGYYQLTQAEAKTVPAYRLAYRKGYALETSQEILHSVRVMGYDPFTSGRYCWHSWYTANVPRNLYWPTQEYVDLFGWSNGDPFDYKTAYDYVYEGGTPENPGELKFTSAGTPNASARGLNSMFLRGKESSLSQMLLDVTLTRDPRLYEECIVNGMQKHLDWTTGAMSGDIWELWAGGTDGLSGIKTQTGMFGTGYGYNKYYMGDGTTSGGDNIRYQTQWVYLSLNEMYLMMAEAELMKTNPDIQKACEAVDVVRARVGLGSLKQRVFSNKAYTDAIYTAETEGGLENSCALLDEILNERAKELGLQDIRWFDMIRYKRTDWMTKPLHGIEIHRLKQNAKGEWVEADDQWTGADKLNDKSSKQPHYFTYKIVEITSNKRVQWGMSKTSNDVRKWLLTPFPQKEINKEYGLVQNPGWE